MTRPWWFRLLCCAVFVVTLPLAVFVSPHLLAQVRWWGTFIDWPLAALFFSVVGTVLALVAVLILAGAWSVDRARLRER